jgi:hypothetical protein
MSSTNKLIVRCVVACLNSNGEPDFFFVKVGKESPDTDDSLVTDKAIEIAEDNGYECYGSLVYTPDESAFKAFTEHAFVWETATLVWI